MSKEVSHKLERIQRVNNELYASLRVIRSSNRDLTAREFNVVLADALIEQTKIIEDILNYLKL